MFKVTMVNNEMDASILVKEMSEAWQAVAPAMALNNGCNVHVEDTETGEVVFLFQDGEIKHMEPDALIGFLDMVYAVDPLLALTMAFDLLATMEAAGLGE